MNWAYVGYDDMVLGLPAAMASAGLKGKVKLVTIDNEPATQAYMKNGQELVASDGFPGPEIMWRSVDFLLRTSPSSRPHRAPSTTSRCGCSPETTCPSTTSGFPLVKDYQAQYKALWGIS